MPLLIQCPACKTSCSIAETNCGAPVRCPKCGKPFLVKPTGDGRKSDTNSGPPASNTNPFPALPAEFGRYRILKLLGRGGMGAVYLAQDSQLGRQCALKVPFFDAAKSPQRAERFVREARSAAVLQHPNICTVFDAGQINGRPFITMAYIAGAPLEHEIDPDAPMPQVLAAEIVRKIALALQHAHRAGIVHRDLKPANVMMTADGEPVVMDFGLAKRVDGEPNQAKLTNMGAVLGTPSYMSPEQVKGDLDAIGPATDVYSLGVMLFEMLTGQTPYTGPMSVIIGRILTAPPPPVQEFRADVDGRLNAACLKARAKEPADRFAGMREFAEALGSYLNVPSASPAPRPARPAPGATKPSSRAPDRPSLDGATRTMPPRTALKKAKKRTVAAPAPRAVSGPLLMAGAAACLLTAVLSAVLVLWAAGAFGGKKAPVAQVNPATPLNPAPAVAPAVNPAPPVAPPADTTPPATAPVNPAPPAATTPPVVPPKETPAPPVAPPQEVPMPPVAPADKTPPPAEVTNSIGMKLKLIPAGQFVMGSPDSDKDARDNEKARHNVEITRPFYMGVYHVTRGQFAAFAKDADYKTEAESAAFDFTWRKPPGGPLFLVGGSYAQTDNEPVVYVSWNDAVRFCEWLSKKEGKTYELPTEAEWEYACRAGTKTTYFFGDDPKDLGEYAWFDNNSGNRTHPVGQKKPNPWGLYDMTGNVWQWCADGDEDRPYDKSDVKDPINKGSGANHLGRGGSWSSVAGFCRSANRGGYGPSLRPVSDGFRVVLRLPAKTP